jgi:uncharacterized protein
MRSARAQALIEQLGLQPHPEGGWYREVFRSTLSVQPADERATRAAMTSIDFLLEAGQFSAWHRVQSDEAWHLLEGGPLVLWLIDPALAAVKRIELGPHSRRHVVPAMWWQAAEPTDSFAYVGATVGPGFDFADFAFGRDEPQLVEAVNAQGLARLL